MVKKNSVEHVLEKVEEFDGCTRGGLPVAIRGGLLGHTRGGFSGRARRALTGGAKARHTLGTGGGFEDVLKDDFQEPVQDF